MNTQHIDIAHFKPINSWEPNISDFVIWHGWFTHWFGVILEIHKSSEVKIAKSGLPFLLFQFDEYELSQKKNNILVPISKIRSSRAGEYTVFQNNTWFI